MKTRVKLAGGDKLSYLKEVNIELDLSGAQYDLLSRVQNTSYEVAVLSVLSELIDEDANRLTLSELYHLFTLVKINSLGPNLKITQTCYRIISRQGEDPHLCGTQNTLQYSFSDSDVKTVPKDYKVPIVALPVDGQPTDFKVMPPTIAQEIALLSYFSEVKGISRLRVWGLDENDTESPALYQKHRSLLFLHNSDSGIDFSIDDTREKFVAEFVKLPIRFIKTLYDAVDEVSSFGIVNKEAKGVCSACGSPLTFPIALGSGLTL